MGRSYAGILGPLAFITVIFRGLLDGATLFGTLQTSVTAMIAFSAIGMIAGTIGNSIVQESVRSIIDAELRQQEELDRDNVDLLPN